MTNRRFLLALSIGLLSFVVATPAVRSRADLVSYALVNDDATLRVRNKRVHLYGIHIPPSERTCRRAVHPVRCGSRAALALDFKIQGFVHCDTVYRNHDRSLVARCENDGVDLSEYLLSLGWAMALPNAPFAYHAIERIARQRALGVWGFPADLITR